jgi:hypothetical protein
LTGPIFIIFPPVRFVLVQLASSPPFPLPYAASPPVDVTMPPCHASFPWSQDELATFPSSSDNTSSRRLPSQAKIKALNSQHHHRPPSSDCTTHTLYYHKKVISTFATIPTNQSALHFVFSLAKAPHHQSFNHRRRSLSPSSHAHRPSAQ